VEVENVALDFEKLRENANAYAANVYECEVTLERDDGDPCVGTFVMYDEEGIETCRVEVTDAGEYRGQQMMSLSEEADDLCYVSAFGDVLARLMWC
jgi:hypothetical protein